MTKESETKKPDGFICKACGRVSYAINLAPYCLKCRLNRDVKE